MSDPVVPEIGVAGLALASAIERSIADRMSSQAYANDWLAGVAGGIDERRSPGVLPLNADFDRLRSP